MSQLNLNKFLANVDADAVYEELDDQAMENVAGGSFYVSYYLNPLTDPYSYMSLNNSLGMSTSSSGGGTVSPLAFNYSTFGIKLV